MLCITGTYNVCGKTKMYTKRSKWKYWLKTVGCWSNINWTFSNIYYAITSITFSNHFSYSLIYIHSYPELFTTKHSNKYMYNGGACMYLHIDWPRDGLLWWLWVTNNWFGWFRIISIIIKDTRRESRWWICCNIGGLGWLWVVITLCTFDHFTRLAKYWLNDRIIW